MSEWWDADQFEIGAVNLLAGTRLMQKLPKSHPVQIVKFRAQWERERCWWCEERTEITKYSPMYGEVHHMAPAWIGRYDARWQFAWLCRRCHQHGTGAYNAAGMEDIQFGRLLRLKLEYDPEGTHWTPFVLLRGKALPEIVDLVKWCDWKKFWELGR